MIDTFADALTDEEMTKDLSSLVLGESNHLKFLNRLEILSDFKIRELAKAEWEKKRGAPTKVCAIS